MLFLFSTILTWSYTTNILVTKVKYVEKCSKELGNFIDKIFKFATANRIEVNWVFRIEYLISVASYSYFKMQPPKIIFVLYLLYLHGIFVECIDLSLIILFINPRPEGYGSHFVVHSFCQPRYREQRSLLRSS